MSSDLHLALNYVVYHKISMLNFFEESELDELLGHL